jgi:hypothetical protein
VTSWIGMTVWTGILDWRLLMAHDNQPAASAAQ